MSEDREIHERKPGESMFTLPVPVRGSSKAATVVVARQDMGIHHSESMYQLLGQSKPVRKGEEATTMTGKEYRKKLS